MIGAIVAFFFTIITKIWILDAYHRLFGDIHQVFDVVVLVLLKGREQHVQHLLFVCSCSFALLLLFPLILQLQQTADTDQSQYHLQVCIFQ